MYSLVKHASVEVEIEYLPVDSSQSRLVITHAEECFQSKTSTQILSTMFRGETLHAEK